VVLVACPGVEDVRGKACSPPPVLVVAGVIIVVVVEEEEEVDLEVEVEVVEVEVRGRGRGEEGGEKEGEAAWALRRDLLPTDPFPAPAPFPATVGPPNVRRFCALPLALLLVDEVAVSGVKANGSPPSPSSCPSSSPTSPRFVSPCIS